MTVPLWAILIPIGLSAIALVISVMTYLLAIKRDEEAREFILIEKQHQLVLMVHRHMAEVDSYIRMDQHRAIYHKTKDELKAIERKLQSLDFSRNNTREARRNLESLFRDLAVLEVMRETTKQSVENLVKYKANEKPPQEG